MTPLLMTLILAAPPTPAMTTTPTEGLVGDRFVLQLSAEQIAADTIAMALCDAAHDATADCPEATSPPTLGLDLWVSDSPPRRVAIDEAGRAEVQLDQPGRYNWRLVAVDGDTEHPIAEAMTGPVVRDRSLEFDLVAEGPVTLPTGQSAVSVEARAVGLVRSRVVWRVDEGPWTEGKAERIFELGPGAHRLEARAYSDLRGGAAAAEVSVNLPGGLEVQTESRPLDCDPTLTRACAVELSATLAGGTPPYVVQWQPMLGDRHRLDGPVATHRYPGGQHTARVWVTDAKGVQVTAETIVKVQDNRLVVAPVEVIAARDDKAGASAESEDGEAGTRESESSGFDALSDTLRRSLKRSIRFLVVEGQSPEGRPGQLCTLRALGAETLAAWARGRNMPYDVLLCPRVVAHDAGFEVNLRAVGLIGNPDIEARVDCGLDVDECLNRVAEVALHTVDGMVMPALLDAFEPAEALATGTLDIRTEAPGAEVRVNGALVGRTPIALEVPVGRAYEVEVRRGDRAQRMRAELKEPITLPLTFRLDDQRTWFEVSSEPSDAAVYIEDEYIGQTPIRRHRVPEGVWRVRLVHPERGSIEREVQVSADSGPLHVVLPQLDSTLTVNNTGAPVAVTLDSQPTVSLGTGQSRTWTKLKRGAHRVCVDNGAREDCEQFELPRDEPLVLAMPHPPERTGLDDEDPQLVEQPMRLGTSVAVGYRLVAERSYFLPPGSVFGGGVELDHIALDPLDPIELVVRASYAYSSGMAETRVAGRDLPVAMTQHAVQLSAGVHLPMGIQLGGLMQGAHLAEVLNPTEASHQSQRTLYSLAVGPEAGIDVLAPTTSRFGLHLSYSILFVVAPRETEDEVGRVHALVARTTFYPW